MNWPKQVRVEPFLRKKNDKLRDVSNQQEDIEDETQEEKMKEMILSDKLR